MSIIQSVGIPIGTAVISAILSGFISWRVAIRTTERRIELQQEQREREWYEKAVTLLDEANNDWWDVMNSQNKVWEVESLDTFRERRDEIRQHTAEGRALGIDEDLLNRLRSIAATFRAAAGKLQSGEALAKIEKESLMPEMERVEKTQKNDWRMITSIYVIN